jgi:O-antigen/teichoic acid export membrane protein
VIRHGPGGARARMLAGARILSVLFTGTLVSSGLSFVSQMLVARSLPIVEVGRLAALLAAINFLTPIGSAGVNWFLLQIFGRERGRAVRWLPNCARLVAATSMLACCGLAAYIGFSDVRRFGAGFVLCCSVPILLGQTAVELSTARFQLEDRYNGLAIWQALTQAGRCLVVVLAVVGGLGGAAVLAGYGLVGALGTGSGALLLAGLGSARLRLAGAEGPERDEAEDRHAPSFWETAVQALPFALVTMFYVLFFQGGVVILDWLAGAAAAAVYNAAFLIVAAISLVPQVIYMKFLTARIYRWAEHDRGTFNAALHVGIPTMAGLGLLGGLMSAVLAPWLVPLLFGGRYEGAVLALAILSAGIPVRFVQTAYSSAFVSRAEVSQKARYLGISAVTTVAANFILVPWVGVNGAAVANVLAEIVLLFLNMHGVMRHIPAFNLGDTFRPSVVRSSLRHLMALDVPERSRPGGND